MGDYTQKTLKNHAVIHDACGFMLRNLGVGAGYGFVIFHTVWCVYRVVVQKGMVCWIGFCVVVASVK